MLWIELQNVGVNWSGQTVGDKMKLENYVS